MMFAILVAPKHWPLLFWSRVVRIKRVFGEKMPACAAVWCTQRSSSTVKNKGVTFHSFPSDPTRRALWVNAVGRENWQPSRYSKLCSLHFREEDIDRTSLVTVRIREHGVPSIFPEFRRQPLKHWARRHIALKPTQEIILPVKCKEEVDEQPSSSQEMLPKEIPSRPSTPPHDPLAEIKKQLDEVCKRNLYYRDKMKSLEQEHSRLKKRNSNLNDILHALWKNDYIDEELVCGRCRNRMTNGVKKEV